jgi:pyruvoyl-dependent arginine decarboxylase (PvlArgDC)
MEQLNNNQQATRVLKAGQTLSVVFSRPAENPAGDYNTGISVHMFPDKNISLGWFEDSIAPISAEEYNIDSSITMEDSRRNFQGDLYHHSPYSEVYGKSTLYNIR